MNKKAAIEIPFKWMFAIIVGAVVLFLAIFISIKIINIEGTSQDAELSKEIGILTNPLETSFETAKSSSLGFGSETRIYSTCKNIGNFGKQIIQTSQKRFGEWSESNIEVSFENKYLFAENPVEGKEIYVFTKPIEFGFKITDAIYLISKQKEYCFVNAPTNILKEITEIQIENILFQDKVSECSEQSYKICFDVNSNLCDVKVNQNLNSITKNSETIFFSDSALMYAGIFSDNENYECQIKRIMQRYSELLNIYLAKQELVDDLCKNNVNLKEISAIVEDYQGSENLNEIKQKADEIQKENENSYCMLW